MSKTKSITELVTELQTENESLQHLKKLFNMAVKAEFGYDTKEVHAMINKQEMYEKRRAEKQGQQSGSEQREE